MFNWLFKKKPKPTPFYFVAQLNARLRPEHRAEYFEDSLDAVLKNGLLGEITGGGSLLSKEGEIEYCDIEIQVRVPTKETADLIIQTLERLGAPKGSKLHLEAEDRQILFGQHEGLAIYLNGTDLPDEVYQQSDSNFVISEIDRLLAGEGRVLSWWQGPTETAIYVYGGSFEGINILISAFLDSYPLCQQCRIEQIA